MRRRGMGGYTDNSRPDTCDCHVAETFSLEIHGQANGKNRHRHLPHGVGGFTPGEAAVNGWAHNDQATGFPLFQIGQRRLNNGVQPFRVDLLHELESFHGGILDGGPPYCPRIINHHIDATVYLRDIYDYHHDFSFTSQPSNLDVVEYHRPTVIVCSISSLTEAKSLVSTGMAIASPPASLISLSTVLIVDSREFGSGGNGVRVFTSLVDLAATTTLPDALGDELAHMGVRPEQIGAERFKPLYWVLARSIATWRPIPLDAPTTTATFMVVDGAMGCCFP